MRFLVDECTGPSVARWLREQGHDALSVYERARGLDDASVMEWATREHRILITSDKEFGTRVVQERQASVGVLLTQLATLSSLPACAGTIPTRTRRRTMLDKIIATCCILDDLLKILRHRDDPQAKITDRESLTIAILACQEFGGNRRKALQWVKALQRFSFVPSESRFNRRLHRLMPLLQALAPLFHALWQHLEPRTDACG
jgi:predicted nuclease of predicted toxin-antitoxin system